jgi:hypothetical protein
MAYEPRYLINTAIWGLEQAGGTDKSNSGDPPVLQLNNVSLRQVSKFFTLRFLDGHTTSSFEGPHVQGILIHDVKQLSVIGRWSILAPECGDSMTQLRSFCGTEKIALM